MAENAKAIKKVSFPKLRTRIFTRLEKELSPKLYYHGPHHTRDDVLPAAERLAAVAGIEGEELHLLRVAVLYHDIGYIEHYLDHEAIGSRIATEELPEMGYTPEQIQKVVGLIMATRMPHNPRTDLQKIICDADLDSLGRDDFFVISHSLRLELKEMGIQTSLKEWYTRQLKFLESHQYLSEAAVTLKRIEGKQRNIKELREVLNLPLPEPEQPDMPMPPKTQSSSPKPNIPPTTPR